MPLTDRNGQEEVALRENRHPILQAVGTSLHRARVLASGTSGTSSSVHCGDSAFDMVTAAALTQRLLRASSFRKRLRRFRARRSARLTAAGRRRSIGLRSR